MTRLVLSGAVGAGLQYFLDRQRGLTRRTQARDRVAGRARRRARRLNRTVEQKSEYLGDRMQGLRHEAGTRTTPSPPANDRELVDRIRSKVLGREEFRHYTINVSAAYGVVDLRGVLQHPEEIRALVKAVEDIEGVDRVESYLHLPNTPVPGRRS